MGKPARIFELAAVAAAIGLFGCGGGGSAGPTPPPPPPPPPAPVPANLLAVSAQNQNAAAGQSIPVTVRVTTSAGAAFQGATVAFVVTAGGGSVNPPSASTDASGQAATSWTLGTTIGQNTLTASSGSLAPLVFSASGTAGNPATITVSAGGNQTGTVGTALPVPPAVLVRDGNGNPVANALVTFTVTAGGGALTGSSPLTNALGIATVGSWTLGNAAGAQALSASVGGLAPAVFNATATPGPAATIAKVAGDLQTIRVGSTLPVAPAVLVRDAFQNPVSNVQVAFQVTLGGGAITGSAPLSNAQGIASLGTWTLGLFSAAQAVSATVAGVGQVTFTATGISGWTNSSGSGIVLTSVFANEGSLFGSGLPWSATLLQTPPLLGISCGTSSGLYLVSVFNSHLITQSGIVTFAFDNDPLQGAIWDELSPDFDILFHPGPQSATRNFIAAMALSRTFTFTFRDFRGGVLFAPVFDVRGLSLELPRLLAFCP